MTHIPPLPPEILLSIVNCCAQDRSTLSSLRLVSKRVNDIATPLYYSHCVVNTRVLRANEKFMLSKRLPDASTYESAEYAGLTNVLRHTRVLTRPRLSMETHLSVQAWNSFLRLQFLRLEEIRFGA